MNPEELAKHYASMLDGELLKLARQSSELLPEAQQALAAELRKRELDPPEPDKPVPLPPVPHEYVEANVDPDEVVVIRKFRDFPEAMIAKGSLDAAGIECFLADENMIRMNWLYSNFLGGLKLAVREEDVDAALDVLEQPIPPSFEVDGIGGYEQPRCPKCSSLDIEFEKFDKRWWGVGMYANLPLLITKDRWKCWSCGHRWKETPDAEHVQPSSTE
jgi:hypothetical protein